MSVELHHTLLAINGVSLQNPMKTRCGGKEEGFSRGTLLPSRYPEEREEERERARAKIDPSQAHHQW